jgi:hypothetical protein
MGRRRARRIGRDRFFIMGEGYKSCMAGAVVKQ